MVKMEYRKLGQTDMDVSVLSFGGSALGGVFGSTDEAESFQVVHRAINSGINFIDTAPWYGQGKSEAALGQALKNIPRHKYYIATKVGRYEPQVDRMFDFSAKRIIQSVDESLHRLGLNYVDIIQVHDMEFAPNINTILSETLPALQKIKESGKTRYIGITGYPLELFRTVLERSPVKIDTLLTYCRYSMNDTSLKNYLPFFKKKGVGVINASPLSMGLLSQRSPPSWHPAPYAIKQTCADAAQYAASRGVDIARLAVQFSLANPDIETTLFSTSSLEILERNLRTFHEEQTDLERQVMNEVLNRYMKPLENMNWEGIEVRNYWNELHSLRAA